MNNVIKKKKKTESRDEKEKRTGGERRCTKTVSERT